MLSINIPANGPSRINFSSFMNYLLPVPTDGIATKGNNDLVLLFDNEKDAINYAEQLKQLPGSQRKIGNEIVAAIEKIVKGILKR